MGKPLSRPDCLRQNPTCLGKGEEEDGYIEDCYVPQRSIYDTMRINEQIDQGSKLNQTSKSTMEKIEGSTISSNGTLGAAANVFESRAPEGKKLDERIIFDALKLSSDVQKSAPVPPRRRPNAERKDNINRRSWKSFMPPNFPEFAERMEASLSEVSEAGVSNPSLQEKKESSSALTESSGHVDHKEPQSESVTLEHVSKSIGIPEMQDVKNLGGNSQDFRLQQRSESSSREFQPLESEAAAASGNTDVMQEHRFPSATWPRAMKSLAKGGFSEKQHPLGDTACTVELPPLSPCLSEELLDSELRVLVTPSLREKTESELKFEEDERWIMMEAAEEWEEEKLSESGKTFLTAHEENSLADIFEEGKQADTAAVVEDGVGCSTAVVGVFEHLALGQIRCSDDPQPAQNCLASVLKAESLDYNCVLTGETAVELRNRTALGLEGLVSDLECTIGPADSEQLSDTDSVQMFLELEKECLSEEGVTPLVELENQASSEGLAPSQDAENSLVISPFSGAALEKDHVDLLKVRTEDCGPGLDGDSFNALDSSQVPNTVEFTAYSDSVRDASTVSEEEGEKVPFSPETAGEFNLRFLTDLESLGGWSNSDHRASPEENVPDSEAKLAKEHSSLSQVDGHEVEGNAEEGVERAPLGSAVSRELTDVTSGSEGEVLPDDSHLPTDEIHWEGEKGAINEEENLLTSLGDVDLCELLFVEGACDEDGEAQVLDYEARLEDRASAHLPGELPEQISQSLQRKSPESEFLSPHLPVGGVRHSRDGVETVNGTKPKLNMALLEEGEAEMRDSNSLLNTFLEEQVTKASNTEAVLESWASIPQKPDAAAAAPTVEDAVCAAVPVPEGAAAASVTVPSPEGHVPAVSVATVEARVPAASGFTLEKVGPGAAVPAPEGTAPAAAVPTTEEDTPEEPVTPAGRVSTSEEPAVPAGAVSTPEEPDTPNVRMLTPEEPAAPAGAGSTPEELATPAGAVPTPEQSAAPACAVSTPEQSATPAGAVPTPEQSATLAGAVSTPEEPATPAGAVSTPEDPATPAGAVSTPEEPATPAGAVSTPEEPATPTDAVPTPEQPAAPAGTVPTPEQSDTPAGAVSTPEEPATPAGAVSTPEQPAAPAGTVPTPEQSATPAGAVSTPEEPATPAGAVSTPEEPATPAGAVSTPEKPATPTDAVPTPEQPAAPAGTVPTPEQSDTLAGAVSTPEEPATPAGAVSTPEQSATPAGAVSTPEQSATPAGAVSIPEEPDAPAGAVPTPEELAAPAAELSAPEESDSPAVRAFTPEEPPAAAAAAPAVEEVLPVGAPFPGDAPHADSVPVSEGTSILEEASPAGMPIQQELDSPAFGVKEVTGTVLHGKVPLAAIDGLNSNEVIVAHFVRAGCGE
ncbi:uncharacterized protein KIAA0754 homolog [Cervus elaphus]|uniref:uncharacterized protein KIAA0754 homolog n=1 Tax=Cervus elaphus TaxID=9860 RepID=UPI001CC2D38C|nr:uncharacterized protein KIAA0754 homolog [Cervus elaphus]